MFFEEEGTDIRLKVCQECTDLYEWVYNRPNVGALATKWWQCGTCWGILGDNPLDWRINTLDPLLLATIVEILSITDTCTNKT